jgi:hypothetical protein
MTEQTITSQMNPFLEGLQSIISNSFAPFVYILIGVGLLVALIGLVGLITVIIKKTMNR